MSHDLRAAGPPREWTPRIWQGCDLFAWLRLLLRNRFAISPRYLHIPCVVTCVSIGHTVLRHVQETWYGSQLDRTPIRHAPLFIIGHWRTGTTLLHEMLILDPRHTFPDTYHCLEPNHFLLTEKFIKRYFRWMMPSRRPMDNMKAGWDRPQEDEFALCMMGQPSPYLTIAFPNHPPQDQDAFDPERLPARARAAWKKAFMGYIRRLTFKDPRRLILKSPTHSCRIPTLLELFPDARFLHIVRDPYVVFPSTVNLWKSLYETHGLQTPTFAGLEEHVFTTFNYLYDRIEQTQGQIPPGQFHELRYEDLIARPMEEMQRVYETLRLGDFAPAREPIERYLQEQSGYRTNRYPALSEEVKNKITQRWGKVIARYGYASSPATLTPPASAGERSPDS